MKDIGYNLWLT